MAAKNTNSENHIPTAGTMTEVNRPPAAFPEYTRPSLRTSAADNSPKRQNLPAPLI